MSPTPFAYTPLLCAYIHTDSSYTLYNIWLLCMCYTTTGTSFDQQVKPERPDMIWRGAQRRQSLTTRFVLRHSFLRHLRHAGRCPSTMPIASFMHQQATPSKPYPIDNYCSLSASLSNFSPPTSSSLPLSPSPLSTFVSCTASCTCAPGAGKNLLSAE